MMTTLTTMKGSEGFWLLAMISLIVGMFQEHFLIYLFFSGLFVIFSLIWRQVEISYENEMTFLERKKQELQMERIFLRFNKLEKMLMKKK